MSPRSCYPVEVRRVSDEHTLRISWDDGHVSNYPYAHLRGWCPCAGCQGHGGERHYVDAPASILERIVVVGSYALQLAWSDGHDMGIYSYRYLRELCPCSACAAAPA
jgi:DUF971 family protein